MKAIRTKDEADQALRRCCEIKIAQMKIDAEMNEAIHKARDAAKTKAAGLAKEAGELQAALEGFFLSLTPQALGKRRSLRFTFGRIGMRSRKAVERARGWSEERVIQALKAAKVWRAFVRTKEVLNRDAVRDAWWREGEALAKCGLRYEPGETFFVDPDVESLGKEKADPSSLLPRRARDGGSLGMTAKGRRAAK